MNLISFRIAGPFAAFKDPSVTSSQAAYHIPSKSAIVGLLGAMIGVNRPDVLGDMYGEEYLGLFGATRVGLRLESIPRKAMFYSNRRSLKGAKTKPFKTEVMENPSYTVYAAADGAYHSRLAAAVKGNVFAYPPYLGHAYCPANVWGFAEYDASEISSGERITSCVVVDGSEAYGGLFKPDLAGDRHGSIIIERHTHHFLADGRLDGRVLKYWIPVSGAMLEIEDSPPGGFSRFYSAGDDVVCLY